MIDTNGVEQIAKILATHTHSGPGGFFQYMLYNIPSAGFVSQTLDLLVQGTVESVKRAHAKLEPARVFYARGDLFGASINRSPTSYLNNPQEERQKYEHDTDKTMHLLKFVDRQNRPMGVLNWFAVHGTSMNNTNHLISSDNKGAAALFLEQDFNPPGTLPGKASEFVAIFAQANEGDVSPNTAGPRCIDTGLPCDPMASTCGNPPRNEMCIASGPGRDMFESTKIIAYHQYKKSRQLFLNESQQIPITGPISVVHEHIDMTHQIVPKYPNAVMLEQRLGPEERKFLANDTYHTCQAALGYSFAAGTTDGPGAFDFRQGRTTDDGYWNLVRDLLRRPSHELVECHKPKPVLLSTGEMDFPYTWHPRIIPTQLFQWGQLAIVGLPGEFTTMAGRRVRAAVEAQLPNHYVILSGLSNVYSSYVTTLEEFVVQRYEGASTLYGPHTLQAYINQFSKLSNHLKRKVPIESDLSPPDLSKSLFSLKPGVIYDGTPIGSRYGDIINDVASSYTCGQRVNVSFVSANPRNNPRLEDSFLYILRLIDPQKLIDPQNQHIIANDASWDTRFIWKRTNTLVGSSKATIIWDTPHDCTPGHYVISHYGASKSLFSDRRREFVGRSSVFELTK